MEYKLTIPENQKMNFMQRLDKLNQRCMKFNVPQFEVQFGQTEILTVDTSEGTKHKAVVPVTITGDYPTIEGWRCIAKIQHGTPTLIHTRSEEDLERFRHKLKCDHCGHRKIRKHSFILQNVQTGELKQVGKTCLQDFIQRDPTSFLKGYSLFEAAEKLFDEFQNLSMWVEPIEFVVQTIFYSIHDRGYHGTYSEFPTFVDVRVFLLASPKRRKEDFGWDVEQYQDLAAEFIKMWRNNNQAKNAFEFNVREIVGQDVLDVESPNSGLTYLCGAVAHYIKTKDENSKQQYVNQWIGEIGERRAFEVTVERVIVTESYYGITKIHKFRDKEGHLLVWFANTTNCFSPEDRGKRVTIVGTVKKHDEYQDQKQTIISRVKIVESDQWKS